LVRGALRHVACDRPASLETEDVYAYGTVGLIDAVDRFDGTRGVKFETYAVTRIRGYLKDQLRSMDWLSRSTRSTVKFVRSTADRMEQSLGRTPAGDELAHETGLQVGECARALADGAVHFVSLDSVSEACDDSNIRTCFRESAESQTQSPSLEAELAELRAALVDALAALPKRERDVLRLRYFNEWTHRQIAANFGISESRVSQLHSQGLGRMRRALHGRFGDAMPEQYSA
jgi:RNA polymerase sigma factor for flagellar operon FliA